jgi:hypothetical protein
VGEGGGEAREDAGVVDVRVFGARGHRGWSLAGNEGGRKCGLGQATTDV